MATTYLELTNRVLRLLNEVELTSSDFASARGIHAAAKTAVLDTVRDINTQKFEWPFNQATATQVLTVGQEQYSWPADFKVVDWESFYIEKDDTFNINTMPLKLVNKNEWYAYLRPQDLDSLTDGRSIPYYVFEDNNGWGISPSPNEAYTIKYRYFLQPTDLDLYSDVCNIPTVYDYVITEGAINRMYMFLDNDQRAAKSENSYRNYLNAMASVLIPKDKYLWDGRVNQVTYRRY